VSDHLKKIELYIIEVYLKILHKLVFIDQTKHNSYLSHSDMATYKTHTTEAYTI